MFIYIYIYESCNFSWYNREAMLKCLRTPYIYGRSAVKIIVALLIDIVWDWCQSWSSLWGAWEIALGECAGGD